VLLEALADAAGAGYTVAGFSGGEPLLYPALRDALEQAHRCGMLTTVTTNGILLDARRLELLQDTVDLLAISLDGIPQSHNRMRGSDRAFRTMASRLESVRASGLPFGFIFTLTQHNLHELAWVARFAREQGASLLQVHPLEEVGRAAMGLDGSSPDDVEAAYAFLEAARIHGDADGSLRVQLDLADRERLRFEPERIYAQTRVPRPDAPLSEYVAPLVLEADGMLVPIQHGFPRRYALGNLHRSSLRSLGEAWKHDRWPLFHELCRSVHTELSAGSGLPFVNWYEVLERRASARAGVTA
jgi:MoaA/NifB/PqqE/SkfB family radical SAM enzyme